MPVSNLSDWSQDGISYLLPEIRLLHKARSLRPKDQQDFDATWPLLDRSARAWLRDAVQLTQPTIHGSRRLRDDVIVSASLSATAGRLKQG